MIKFAFFGTHPLSDASLNALEKAGFLPSLIVAGSDSFGRNKTLAFPPEKIWGMERDIRVIQPEKITKELIAELSSEIWDVFIVASYGKILPEALLSIPRRGTINLHPSLLPRLRGPSPMRSAILLDERETGVSIMLLDAEMDHGPILGQKKIVTQEWPPRGRELDALLAEEGGNLLANVLPGWVSGDIEPREQDHSQATYCTFFKKEDGLLDLTRGDPYQNFLKIRAFDGWPGTYAFFTRPSSHSEQSIRVAIIDAHMQGSKLMIDTVKPEGKKEMPYADFRNSGAEPQ